MRIILITGGGGAGVSTLAAATAALSGARGSPTVLLGHDPAALRAVLGEHDPPGVSLRAALPAEAFGDETPAVLAWARRMLGWLGVDASLTEDLDLLPGARTLAALIAAVDLPGCRVVDLGSAEAALPLIHLLCIDPRTDREKRPEAGIRRLLQPIITYALDMPRPEDTVRRAGEDAVDRIGRLRALLRNPNRLSLRLLLPNDGRVERLRQDALTVAGLWGIALDLVAGRSRGGYRRPVAERAIPWSDAPPIGAEALVNTAAAVYGEAPPDSLLAPAAVPRVEMRAKVADLVLPVPSRPAPEFRVRRSGDSLDVSAGRWRRRLLLPVELRPLQGRRGWHDGDVFRVRFGAAVERG